MGKGLSFVLASVSLGFLALLFATHARNPLEDAALLAGCLVLSALAWIFAFGTSVFRVLRTGEGWWAVILLAAFFWLPAIPVLIYGVVGALSALAARRRDRRTAKREVVAAVVRARPEDVLVDWKHALRDEARA